MGCVVGVQAQLVNLGADIRVESGTSLRVPFHDVNVPSGRLHNDGQIITGDDLISGIGVLDGNGVYEVAGNFNADFNDGTSEVRLVGAESALISSVTKFYDLTIDKVGSASVFLNASILINNKLEFAGTANRLTADFGGVTVRENATIVGADANNYVRTAGFPSTGTIGPIGSGKPC